MEETKARTHTPLTGLAGLRENWAKDLLAGFLVFLIALPLCIGISKASGYPAIAGLYTAIIGGIFCGFLSNSELTIKGPAAGLIVIALGCITGFKELGYTDMEAYRLALGVGVAAGLLQILFAIFRSGILGDFFPTSAVHGMLAAIGIIIAAKQVHFLLGVTPQSKGPIELLGEIPHSFVNLNPEVAAIGLVSLLILFGLPLIRNKYVRRIPAPMLVLLISIPMGIYFDLEHEHHYFFGNHDYSVGPGYLVESLNLFDGITFPDFAGLLTGVGIRFVIMFALIGTLESLLSAKAIDLLDPWKRKSNLDRDILAIGVANTGAALVGGLPMISEIVRSSANINNGARTRFSNMFHGLFLLCFLAAVPHLIHQIPLAALAAMLVYTGYRLASPKEWHHAFQVGREQFLIFAATVIATLATDLLIGIGVGIAVKLLIHLWNGAPIRALLRPPVAIEEHGNNSYRVRISSAAVFTNWIGLKKRILALDHAQNVVIDLSDTRLVDHTVMASLHELQREFAQRNCQLHIVGLDGHRPLSRHPHSTHKKIAKAVK